MFDGINNAQWLWYFHNLMEDRDEEYKQKRDLIEYHASFIEPEAVSKIRDAREQAVEVPDDEFSEGIKRILGRSFGVIRRKGGKIEAADPTVRKDYKRQVKQEEALGKASKNDYKHWVHTDLEK